MLNGENQVPVLSPHDVAVVDGEASELAGVEVLVVLWVGMADKKWTEVDNLYNTVVEEDLEFQIFDMFNFCYMYVFYCHHVIDKSLQR